MKGLLLKDFLSIRKQGKLLFLISAFYILFSFLSNTTNLIIMTELLFVMMPITTMSFDEQCKWDKYALSMPISRKTIVLSKYLFGLIAALIGIVIVFTSSLILNQITGQGKVSDSAILVMAIAGIAITFLALILPLFYKFGLEKGRILMIVVCFIPILLMYTAYKMGFSIPSGETLRQLAYLSPIAVLIILLASILISIAIYDKKEF